VDIGFGQNGNVRQAYLKTSWEIVMEKIPIELAELLNLAIAGD
jgi:hypothetical protein